MRPREDLRLAVFEPQQRVALRVPISAIVPSSSGLLSSELTSRLTLDADVASRCTSVHLQVRPDIQVLHFPLPPDPRRRRRDAVVITGRRAADEDLASPFCALGCVDLQRVRIPAASWRFNVTLSGVMVDRIGALMGPDRQHETRGSPSASAGRSKGRRARVTGCPDRAAGSRRSRALPFEHHFRLGTSSEATSFSAMRICRASRAE